MLEHVRIGILDPHEIVRDGLNLFLETVDAFVFVGEAASWEEVVPLCHYCSPDILLCEFLEVGSNGYH